MIPDEKMGGRKTVKRMIRLLAMLIVLTLALPLGCALADDGVSSTYTYNYDYWGALRDRSGNTGPGKVQFIGHINGTHKALAFLDKINGLDIVFT